jgi:hypothetical protein
MAQKFAPDAELVIDDQLLKDAVPGLAARLGVPQS